MSLKLILFSILAFLGAICFSNEEKESFDPWYTGPLLAPGDTNKEPGRINVQTYLFVNTTHAIYSEKGHNTIADVTSVSPAVSIQIGLNSFLDITFFCSAKYNHQKNINTVVYDDTIISLGFQICRDKKNTFQPNIRFIFEEQFPTGRYQQLNPNKNKLDAGGGGTYQTGFYLNIGKIVYWIPSHPIEWRFSFAYAMPSLIHVKDFHSYGGGYNTYGKLRPPYVVTSIFSLEYSFTQRWVFSMDFSYSYATSTSFSGTTGTTEDGLVASNKDPHSVIWSLAPAIEYNFNQYLGIITGVWFSVDEKNSNNFVNYIFSVTYEF